MSALAENGRKSRGHANNVEAMPIPNGSKGSALQERILILRDTILVFGWQVVFRTTMTLRRWN